MDLFDRLAEEQDAAATPLAERMRPQRLEEVVGQQHLLGEEQLLRRAIAQDRVPSLILCGNGHCARVICHAS